MANVVTRVNRFGIPAIKSISANLSDTRLTITFASHVNVSDYFQGFFVANVTGVPTPPTEALPVYLATEGFSGWEKQLFTCQGAPVTTDEVVDGVYLCFYDSSTGKVRVML